MNTKLLLKLTLLAAWAVAPTSLGASWDGEARDHKFSSAKNWSDNKVPAHKSTQYMLDNGDQVTLTQDSKFGRFAMNGGSVLNIVDGFHYRTRPGSKVRDMYFKESGGSVNQTGGTYRVGHLLVIGSGNAQQGGTYNLSDGRLWISRESNTLFAGQHNAPRASLQLGDSESQNTAAMNVSGQAILMTRSGVVIGPTGVFHVAGSRAMINIGGDRKPDGAWTQLAGGTLGFAIGQGGASKIFIHDADETPGVQVRFDAGTRLALSFAPNTSPHPGSWVLLEAENTRFDSSTIAGVTLVTPNGDSGWSLSYDNIDGNGVIVATYTTGAEMLFEPE